jgi:hypothetical protein
VRLKLTQDKQFVRKYVEGDHTPQLPLHPEYFSSDCFGPSGEKLLTVGQQLWPNACFVISAVEIILNFR